MNCTELLPVDHEAASLVGRLWVSGPHPGPRPVLLRGGAFLDLSHLAPTISDLLELADPVSQVSSFDGESLGSLQTALDSGTLLAPCDLQAIKACGVTFASSLIERVIEEKALGNPSRMEAHRAELEARIGGSLSGLQPGSSAAQALKEAMIKDGSWSQYLEVGIGPDPELFTKAQPMSAVGCGSGIGLHPGSSWSVSEPEVVLAVNSVGQPMGACLGNDFTLRDYEGRSALLLGHAKDNNASCAIGPLLRLFDEGFTMDDVRGAEVLLQVTGHDGYEEWGTNALSEISRDPEQLISAAIGPVHQYPDGLMLFLGTMFVPGRDRNGPGSGFTHAPGDRVRVYSSRLGSLINDVVYSDQAPPWTFGVRALTRSLAARGVLPG